MKIAEISIKRPTMIIVLFTILTLGGLFSYTQMGYELIPKFETNVVTISTIYPGASPNEVENSVTKKIEDAVAALENVKKLTDAKIISNASASFDKNSDVIYFDSYKLTGFSTKSIILFNQNLFEEQAIFEKDGISLNNIFQSLKNQKFENSMKEIFKERLENSLKDNLYYFIDNKNSLEYTLHFALKSIKARELIRTLALDEILISNGEGCSLGLSKPSRVIQAMGYDELTSRNAITLSFEKNYSINEIDKIVNLISKRY